MTPITLLRSEWPKLHRVLAIFSAAGFKKEAKIQLTELLRLKVCPFSLKYYRDSFNTTCISSFCFSRGGQEPSGTTSSLVIHPLRGDPCILALCRDHRLRVWSCKVSAAQLMVIIASSAVYETDSFFDLSCLPYISLITTLHYKKEMHTVCFFYISE